MRPLLSVLLLAGFALPSLAQTPDPAPVDATPWAVTFGYHSVSTPDDGPSIGAEYRFSARRTLAVTVTSSSARSSGSWHAVSFVDPLSDDRTIEGATLFSRYTDTRTKALRMEHRWTFLPDDTVHPFATLGVTFGRDREQRENNRTQVGQISNQNAFRGPGDTETETLSIGALGAVGTEWDASDRLSLRIGGVIGFGYGRKDVTEETLQSESIGIVETDQWVKYQSTQPLLAFELSAAFRL